MNGHDALWGVMREMPQLMQTKHQAKELGVGGGTDSEMVDSEMVDLSEHKEKDSEVTGVHY